MTLLRDAVLVGGWCDLGKVSGCGDTAVSDVDMVVSGAVSGCLCDLDSVSQGDVVVRVGEVVVRGGDTDVSGIDTAMSGAVSGP